jgi:3,4-dihydroxy 2-butanone 4-phosphate synthase/GTP cyclohydrolase II
VEEIVADMRAGRMVILVDEEDRENEGDLVLASDHVTPEAINFMARFGRGLICLTLTRERCEYLKLPPMAARNGTVYSTAFTVSIEAAEGVTTGISPPTAPAPCRPPWPRTPAQRPGAARPHLPAAGRGRRRADARRPHRSRLRPGRHGRLPLGRDLRDHEGRRHHGPPARSAAVCRRARPEDRHHCRPDPIPQPHRIAAGKVGSRTMQTPTAIHRHAFRDKPSHAVHLALVKGSWSETDEVPVRVHEPLSVLDALEINRSMHSWGLDTSLQYMTAKARAWPCC